MRWDIWAEIEKALVKSAIKPILAVVPDNQDPVLQPAPPIKDFWRRVRHWQDLGWTIALHGYQHLYVAPSGGLVTRRKKSEFASLPIGEQEDKLQRATNIFSREGIQSRVWIAPGNAFDEVTVSLLPRFGFDLISAGWFWGPFIGPHQVTWLPCQLSLLRVVPRGVWTVCYHHNSWTAAGLANFLKSLEQFRGNISSVEQALAQWPPSSANWCYQFCTSPRLSSFVLRAHLKLCKIWAARCASWRVRSAATRQWPPGAPALGSRQGR
jgi:hypothetical protein